MHVLQRERKIGRAEPELTAQLGREPTDEELAAEVELPRAAGARGARGRADGDEPRRPVGEDEDTSLGELFASDDAEPAEEVDRRQPARARSCTARSSELPDREREILRLRYGLTDDGRPQSVEQVVRSLGVSRGRGAPASSTARSSASRARAGAAKPLREQSPDAELRR